MQSPSSVPAVAENSTATSDSASAVEDFTGNEGDSFDGSTIGSQCASATKDSGDDNRPVDDGPGGHASATAGIGDGTGPVNDKSSIATGGGAPKNSKTTKKRQKIKPEDARARAREQRAKTAAKLKQEFASKMVAYEEKLRHAKEDVDAQKQALNNKDKTGQ